MKSDSRKSTRNPGGGLVGFLQDSVGECKIQVLSANYVWHHIPKSLTHQLGTLQSFDVLTWIPSTCLMVMAERNFYCKQQNPELVGWRHGHQGRMIPHHGQSSFMRRSYADLVVSLFSLLTVALSSPGQDPLQAVWCHYHCCKSQQSP